MKATSIQNDRPTELDGIRKGSKTKSSSLVYEGEKDLTISTLENLKGHAFVSKQYISDFINSPNLKKAEKDLITLHLSEYSDGGIRVQSFAKKVKEDLLPLKRNSKATTRHEYTVLKGDLRGSVHNYGEHLYSGPYKTEAGSNHFGSLTGEKKENYFAHCRTEDLVGTDTRRVIEIQSDLFQKDRIENEFNSVKQHLAVDIGWHIPIAGKKYEVLELFNSNYQPSSAFAKVKHGKKESYINLFDKEVLDVLAEKRYNEIKKLQAYRNTWHERIIQGEIRQAAKDKITSLLFPTGETAMKIENLSREYSLYDIELGAKLSPEKLLIGKEFSKMRDTSAERWIILEVLESGRFRAVEKTGVERVLDISLSKGEKLSYTEALEKINNGGHYTETFDISKTDANNPIYKFYEKEVQKCLTKFGGKRILDERGVSWVQISVTPEMAKMPEMAFSISGLEILLSEKQNQLKENIKVTGRQNELSEIRGKSKDNIIKISK